MGRDAQPHAPLRAWLLRTGLTLAATLLVAAPLQAAARAAGIALPGEPRAAFASLVAPKPADAPPPPRIEVVWDGRDVDGDGAPDFANPTGNAPRTADAYGYGHFGARRDGGSRAHEGVDYAAEAGQEVVAPISGFVTKIGFAYASAPELTFVEITNPALGYQARVFYVDPTVEVGQPVRLGAAIGRAISLQGRYPGRMTDHVHLELSGPKGRRFDAAAVLAAREVVVEAGD
ncbi:MAG: M23 family metallopeptidase [Phenylobacterium sp.]|uniref:M23 family metallopeptidase n=1 Tax=Phenylobacterium sp. TaxID=1871053 RepID=UPI00391A3FA0